LNNGFVFVTVTGFLAIIKGDPKNAARLNSIGVNCFVLVPPELNAVRTPPSFGVGVEGCE
jgi:hypothetical protein